MIRQVKTEALVRKPVSLPKTNPHVLAWVRTRASAMKMQSSLMFKQVVRMVPTFLLVVELMEQS